MGIDTAALADILRPGLEKMFAKAYRRTKLWNFDENWLRAYRRARRIAKAALDPHRVP